MLFRSVLLVLAGAVFGAIGTVAHQLTVTWGVPVPLGLIGSLIVVGLFGAFAWAGATIAMRTRDPFQRLLAAGATALIVGQAIVNLGAVMGILPLTGIPLPLISYGSSSRLVILALVGMLIAISREPQVLPTRTPTPQPDAPRSRRRQPVGA